MNLVCGAKSDRGLKRATNEDRFCADPRLGLFVVCDGMGGQNAGEVASQMAVDAICKHWGDVSDAQDPSLTGPYDPTFLPQTNRLAGAIRHANHMIHQEAQAQPRLKGMGTTVVSALVREHVLSIAHVGDSRLYLLRGESIQPLTADHSMVMDQVRHGLLTEEQVECAPGRHVLTRALGVKPAVDVELGEVPIMNGDVLLLCSDGLTCTAKPEEILSTVRRAGDLQAASEGLIEMANAGGGQDNTTVVLITLREGSRRSWWQGVTRWFADGGGAGLPRKEDRSWLR